MSGLFIGTVLSFAAAGWVLAPILRRAPATHSDETSATDGPCRACGALPEPGARYCSNCGAAR